MQKSVEDTDTQQPRKELSREILDWSKKLPMWQRDCLRRLFENESLSDKDILELTEICKSGHELADKKAHPLDESHLSTPTATSGAVILESLIHHSGVNALAPEQTLNFDPHLTVVYGDNGSGKTGYSRMLKKACRARSGEEKILGNIFAGQASSEPRFQIRYQVDSKEQEYEYSGTAADNSENNALARVSVFDALSASVYVNKETELAFRPLGLDRLDRLAKACEDVKNQLETEQKKLYDVMLQIKNNLSDLVRGDEKTTQLLENFINCKPKEINDIEKPLKELATPLNEDETGELKTVEQSLHDLQAKEPDKDIQKLKTLVKKVETLESHVKSVSEKFSDKNVSLRNEALKKWQGKKVQADCLNKTFDDLYLPGTGSDIWKKLWEAVRLFSEKEAYPDRPFPVVDQDAQCVLCQQHLNDDAIKRLKKFATFISSEAQRELLESEKFYREQNESFTNIVVNPENIQNIIGDIEIEDTELAKKIKEQLKSLEADYCEVIEALKGDSDQIRLPQGGLEYKSVSCDLEIEQFLNTLEDRISTLENSTDSNDVQSKIQSWQTRKKELCARQKFSLHSGDIEQFIKIRKKIDNYENCKKETGTKSITQKSTELTKNFVADKLKKAFQKELETFGLAKKFELQEAGGKKGSLYHKLVPKLEKSEKNAIKLPVPDIASEGEQRCLAIAAFFAELTTTSDKSGIIFDDPVSSLDQQWITKVARCLFESAEERQVIVFTHNFFFCCQIMDLCKNKDKKFHFFYIKSDNDESGLIEEEFPWNRKTTKQRIDALNKEYDELRNSELLDEKRDENVKSLYSKLRTVWERAIEEVLLSKVVLRHRQSIQTQQIKDLAYITTEQCKIVEDAFTKCSRWMGSHDTSSEDLTPVPKPDEFKRDLEIIRNWVK